jgi:hypothetical protein
MDYKRRDFKVYNLCQRFESYGSLKGFKETPLFSLTMSYSRGQTQNELILAKLLNFYAEADHLEQMTRIVSGSSDNCISLRIIDWFVTNYAKKNFTVYMIPAKNKCSTVINGQDGLERFKVHDRYKQELIAYSKERFDPFSRKQRIEIPCTDGTMLETTIGQLNFFRWAIENQVLQYIENNFEDIEQDMNACKKSSKENCVVQGTRKKREELSVSACKTIKKEQVKITVKFS